MGVTESGGGGFSRRHPAPPCLQDMRSWLWERLEARRATQTSSRDQGQVLRGSESGIDLLSRLGTKEVSWDGKGNPGRGQKWVFQNTEESLRLSTWSRVAGLGNSLRVGLCLPTQTGDCLRGRSSLFSSSDWKFLEWRLRAKE